jgi:hypothetical protein
MYNNSYSPDSQLNKTMSDEQFNQVVDAILSGKYSWACLLILRFSGYNPLHYIPYRTYNRLMKTNREQTPSKIQPLSTNSKLIDGQEDRFRTKTNHQLQDLYYLEELKEVDHQSTNVKGGNKGEKRTFSMSFFSHLFSS